MVRLGLPLLALLVMVLLVLLLLLLLLLLLRCGSPLRSRIIRFIRRKCLSGTRLRKNLRLHRHRWETIHPLCILCRIETRGLRCILSR